MIIRMKLREKCVLVVLFSFMCAVKGYFINLELNRSRENGIGKIAPFLPDNKNEQSNDEVGRKQIIDNENNLELSKFINQNRRVISNDKTTTTDVEIEFIKSVVNNSVSEQNESVENEMDSSEYMNKLVTAILLDLNNTKKTDKKNGGSLGVPPWMDQGGHLGGDFVGEDSQEDARENEPCILGQADIYLSWWLNQNGSLTGKGRSGRANPSRFMDLSRIPRSENEFYERLSAITIRHIRTAQYMSMAYNELTILPVNVLLVFDDTVEFLSLTGNNFNDLQILNNGYSPGQTEQIFPPMKNLKELDLRNCNVTHLSKQLFMYLPNLQRLYMSNNKLTNIQTETFNYLPSLIHLDLSYMVASESREDGRSVYLKYDEEIGLEICEDAFVNMTNLRFLDLSFTKLKSSVTNALAKTAVRLEQLSLCYTSLSKLAVNIFVGSQLSVLDVSGNSYLGYDLQKTSLLGLENSLTVLAVDNAGIKSANWLTPFLSLRVLRLRSNSLTDMIKDTMQHLQQLEILDLSGNYLSNWFDPVFISNQQLRILNLRQNNINMLTKTMLQDFANLDYLALGDNNFVCDCLLREFLELAIKNGRNSTCVPTLPPNTHQNESIDDEFNLAEDFAASVESVEQLPVSIIGDRSYDVRFRILQEYIIESFESFNHINDTLGDHPVYVYYKRSRKGRAANIESVTLSPLCVMQTPPDEGGLQPATGESEENDLTSDDIDFRFQLFDFEDDSYNCIDTVTHEIYFWSELEKCFPNITWSLANMRQTTNTLAIILMCLFVVFLFINVIYYKWWYIRYFCIIVKNATILSLMDKKKNDVENIEDPPQTYLYDVFVSYCENNRNWVLEELLPNIEENREINVCLHERDFQVGLSILENIITCMDRSKCLLLIVSKDFLLSQWCQFEMHLAQHRLLETRREQLILVLLEDVPKWKRPKTLQYLMRTKTYIMWPDKNKSKSKFPGECEVFWKRLIRAIARNTEYEGIEKIRIEKK